MKKVLIISLLLIVSSSLLAQSADSLFVQANKLYQQERYVEALSIYEEISSNNLESDDLYYNMANAYYKTNKVAPAVYYYF